MWNSCIFHIKTASKLSIGEWTKKFVIWKVCKINLDFASHHSVCRMDVNFNAVEGAFVPCKNRAPNESNVAKSIDVHVHNDACSLFITMCIGYVFQWSSSVHAENRDLDCVFTSRRAYNNFFFVFLFASVSCELIKWYYVLWYARKKDWKRKCRGWKMQSEPEKERHQQRLWRNEKHVEKENRYKWWKIAMQTKTKTSDSLALRLSSSRQPELADSDRMRAVVVFVHPSHCAWCCYCVNGAGWRKRQPFRVCWCCWALVMI